MLAVPLFAAIGGALIDVKWKLTDCFCDSLDSAANGGTLHSCAGRDGDARCRRGCGEQID
jgi:hypothetical protein